MVENGKKISSGYSLNLPSIDWGSGIKIGLPVSLGYTIGSSGLEIFSSSGVEIMAFQKANLCSWKFGGNEFFQVNYSEKSGLFNNYLGRGFRLPFAIGENIELYLFHDLVIDNLKMHNELGGRERNELLYMALSMYGLSQTDLLTAWDNLVQYITGGASYH